MLFSVAGSIPWNCGLVTAGWLLGENYEALYETIRPFEILIYVVVVLGGAFILIRWIRGRGSPREV